MAKEDLCQDKGAMAEIMEAFLSCPYADRGCKPLFSPWELESHVANCPHEVIICKLTFTKNINNKYLQQSLGSAECRDGCQWCGQLVPLSDIQRHLDEDCAKVPCSCNFREVGCRATLPRAELTAHLDSQIHDHLSVNILSKEDFPQ